MSKIFARMAHLIREIAVFLIPVLTVIKLLIEIADKVANCRCSSTTASGIARAVGGFLFRRTKAERIERAIADDLAFLAAHPTRRR
jgi:hypothetical protein